MDAVARLLTIAFRHSITEPDIDAGFARFVGQGGGEISFGTFCDAVAECLRGGLIREPIRLPEGALHCHWRLELTAAGCAAARALTEPGRNDGANQEGGGGG